MLLPRVIPVLLLKNNGLVKGKKFKKHKYVGDPINTVKIFNEKEVDEVMILDITATQEKKEPNYKLLEQIVSEAFMPLSYGGGINSFEQAKKLFSLGIEKIVLGSIIFTDIDLVKKIVEVYGSQSVCISLDFKLDIFKKYKFYSHSGQKKEKCKTDQFLKQLSQVEFGEILLNAIDRDGMKSGYDLRLLDWINNEFNVPVICSCGASSLNDFKQAIDNGAHSVSAGNYFVYQGKHEAVLISYPKQKELKKLFNKED